MLWDGKSKGTINNVLNLSRDNKLVVVYVAPAKSFQTVRSAEDLKALLTKGDPSSVGKLVHELHLDYLQPNAAGSQSRTAASRMTERSLQVTYRRGRSFAAYLHLLHPTGAKSAKAVASADGLLIVDYAATGLPLGIEITAPQTVPLEKLNQVLSDLGEEPLAEQKYGPVRAA